MFEEENKRKLISVMPVDGFTENELIEVDRDTHIDFISKRGSIQERDIDIYMGIPCWVPMR